MRLGGIWDGWDCGCDNRREIMFTQGGLTAPEMAVLAALFGLVIVGIIKHKRS